MCMCVCVCVCVCVYLSVQHTLSTDTYTESKNGITNSSQLKYPIFQVCRDLFTTYLHRIQYLHCVCY